MTPEQSVRHRRNSYADNFSEYREFSESVRRIRAALLDSVDDNWFIFDPTSSDIVWIGEGVADDIRKIQLGYHVSKKRIDEIDGMLNLGPVPPVLNSSKIASYGLRVNLNHRCNLACEYCYASEKGCGDGKQKPRGTYGGSPKSMSHSVLSQAVTKLSEAAGNSSNLSICFFGGEPLLDENLFLSSVSLVDRVAKNLGKRMRLNMVTNGTIISNDIIQCIRDYKIGVTVSVDGDRENHNRYRHFPGQRPSYDMVVSTIERLSSEGVHFGLRGTIIRNSLNIDAFHHSLAAISREPVGVHYNFYGSDGSRPITEDEVDAISNHCRITTQRILENQSVYRKFGVIRDMLISLMKGAKVRYHCGAGRYLWAVDPDGNVFPCHRFVGMDNYTLGNVRDANFHLKAVPEFVLNAVDNRISTHDGRRGCGQCFAQYICGGGCMHLGATSGGFIGEMPRFFCDYMRVTIRAIVIVLAELIYKYD